MLSSTIASVPSWIFFVSLFFDFEKKTPRCFLNGTIQANGGTTVEITVEIPDPTDRAEDDVTSLITAFGLLQKRVYATMACHFFKCNLFFFDCRSEARNELFRVCNFDEKVFHFLENDGCGDTPS